MSLESIELRNNKATDFWAVRKISYIFGLLLFSMAGTALSAFHEFYIGCLIGFVLMGTAINKLVFIMHECAHGTLLSNKKNERLIGSICGWFLVTDFNTFKSQHLAHHIYFCLDNDPQGSDYNGLEKKSRAGLLWHLIRPLLGLNVFKVLLLNKKADTDKKEVKSGKGPFFGAVIVIHLAILTVVTLGGKVLWTFPLYHLAAGTVGLFLSQVRGFAEHISTPGRTSERLVRTHFPNFLDSFFLYDFNFNYHVEHHLSPQVPAYYLPQLSNSKSSPNFTAEYSPRIISTIVKRIGAAQ